MGRVISTIECPQCGGLYNTDYYYRTGEEYRVCSRCGRHEEWLLERDEAGKPVKDKDGYFKTNYTQTEGFGSSKFAYFAYKEGFGQIYSLSKPVDQSIIDDFMKTLDDPDIDKDESYLSSWDPEKKELVMIYGKMPGTLAEFEEQISKEEAAEEQLAAVNETVGA